ncbi:hypothetical protein KPATCC21470_3353 [Kitasatospora purpeofusca]
MTRRHQFPFPGSGTGRMKPGRRILRGCAPLVCTAYFRSISPGSPALGQIRSPGAPAGYVGAGRPRTRPATTSHRCTDPLPRRVDGCHAS